MAESRISPESEFNLICLKFDDRHTVDVRWPKSQNVTSLIIILSNPRETWIRAFETEVIETEIDVGLPEDLTSQNALFIYGLDEDNKVLLSSVENQVHSGRNTITLNEHTQDSSFTTKFSCSENLQMEKSVIEQKANGDVAFNDPQATDRNQERLLSVQTSSQTELTCSFTEYMFYQVTRFPIELKLPSRELVKYTIYKTDLTECFRHEFITHNTKQDVEKLLEMANNFSHKTEERRSKKTGRKGPISVNFLYRNEPRKHAGIFKKTLKDNNGDQASSINNQIKGLFFMASPDYESGDPPNFSYYGKYRIKIPPQHLISGMNLYFADFYCLIKSHYITLVVTKPGSSEDSYCSPRLVKLDIKDNKFLMYSDKCDKYFTRYDDLWVEVYYTEDINKDQILELEEEEIGDVQPTGGSTHHLHKRRTCKLCNLPKLPGFDE